MSHDNVNIPLQVFSQRLHNQSHFISGCVVTIWILPKDAALLEDANGAFQKHRAKGSKTCFDYGEILDGDEDIGTWIEQQHIHHILSVLLECPDFADYAYLDDPIFEPPPPINQILCGPEQACKQYILGTTDIEEASYEGTDKNVTE